jgi:hypothetical protein
VVESSPFSRSTDMRRIAALFLVAALAAAAVAVPAGASVASKQSRFCKALDDFDLPELSNTTTEKEAAATAAELRKLARKAKGDTKKAIKTLAAGFEDVADGESPRDVITPEIGRAAASFAVAALKCITTNISLPDISLPGS